MCYILNYNNLLLIEHLLIPNKNINLTTDYDQKNIILAQNNIFRCFIEKNSKSIHLKKNIHANLVINS